MLYKFSLLLFLLLLLDISQAGIRVRRRRRSCSAVNGGWSGWSDTSGCQCNHATGVGYISQVRRCNNPAPSCGGAGCSGSSTGSRSCACCKTAHGGWSAWSGWGACKCNSNTGTGSRSASRTCTNPTPSCGGSQCSGSATQTQRCDDQCCKKTNGGWTAWTSWSDCKCDDAGAGKLFQYRECRNPPPSCDGAQCAGSSTQIVRCDDKCCTKTDGGWSGYGPWSKCKCDSNTGKGTKTASKTCTNPAPSCGGAMCSGSAIKTGSCDEECCQSTNGGWSKWNAWVSSCDINCGPGTQSKDRKCTNPVPSCGGKDCEGVAKVTAKCANKCGIIQGEGSVSTGEPVTIRCTLYGAKRIPTLVRWLDVNKKEVKEDQDHHYLDDIVTPYSHSTSIEVSHLTDDKTFICSFVFGEAEISENVMIDFVHTH